jgi:hypothetical protein
MFMTSRKLVWSLGFVLFVAALVGAKQLVRMNEASLAPNQNPSAFYGH